jgi:hypothetical protein
VCWELSAPSHNSLLTAAPLHAYFKCHSKKNQVILLIMSMNYKTKVKMDIYAFNLNPLTYSCVDVVPSFLFTVEINGMDYG